MADDECAGAIYDIKGAIEAINVAMDITIPEDRDRAMILNNLRLFLRRRFERTKLRKDFDRAIDFINLAVKGTPQDHPDQAGLLHNLGIWLGLRIEQTKAIDDIDRNRGCRVGRTCYFSIPRGSS